MLEQILNDLKNAMKTQDKFKLSVLRMLKSAIQMETINKKSELDDSELISAIKKQVKIRKDSIVEFEKYDKLEEVNSLKEEISILNEYLPREMSEAEITDVVNSVFEEVNPTSIKDMGKIMKIVNGRITNADMSLVSKIVKEKLS